MFLANCWTFLLIFNAPMMTNKIALDFVLFDMIGTTVQDAKTGESVILESFKNAFNRHEIDVSYDEINRQRGKSKQIAIETIVKEMNLKSKVQNFIYHDFMNELQSRIIYFEEMLHATTVFQKLKTKEIKIGIGSGLPLHFMMQLMEHLSWNPDDFSYINSSDELPAGRPDPVMIFDAMDKLNYNDKNRILKIGDTVVDVLEGKNAEVLTAMVLSGTQKKENLSDMKPDFIWDSMKDLLNFI